jgi:hypothetical protein
MRSNGLAGWGAVSALGTGLSTLALLVWATDRLRQRGQGQPPQPDPGTAAPSASTVSQSRQPAREYP